MAANHEKKKKEFLSILSVHGLLFMNTNEEKKRNLFFVLLRSRSSLFLTSQTHLYLASVCDDE